MPGPQRWHGPNRVSISGPEKRKASAKRLETWRCWINKSQAGHIMPDDVKPSILIACHQIGILKCKQLAWQITNCRTHFNLQLTSGRLPSGHLVIGNWNWFLRMAHLFLCNWHWALSASNWIPQLKWPTGRTVAKLWNEKRKGSQNARQQLGGPDKLKPKSKWHLAQIVVGFQKPLVKWQSKIECIIWRKMSTMEPSTTTIPHLKQSGQAENLALKFPMAQTWQETYPLCKMKLCSVQFLKNGCNEQDGQALWRRHCKQITKHPNSLFQNNAFWGWCFWRGSQEQNPLMIVTDIRLESSNIHIYIYIYIQ